MFDFSNFGSLKSTETKTMMNGAYVWRYHFSNFGSLKSTETVDEHSFAR